MTSDLKEILKTFLTMPEPWNSWLGFGKRCIWGFALILIIFKTILHTENSTALKAYGLCFFIYLIIFLLNRSYSFKIFTSKKTNLVIAYNTEGINQKKFNKKYQNLITELQNKLNFHNLAEKIKIITCPPDIKISGNNIAEAKALLGIYGSTIVVWGYAAKENGKCVFNTKFSYEFGYPKKKLSRDDAKKIFSENIEKRIQKGLSPIKINLDNFNEQLLPTVLYILGATTLTLDLYDNSEYFFTAFQEQYKKSDLMRKKQLSPTLIEVNDILRDIYIAKIHENGQETKKYIDLILVLRPNDYDGNIAAAFYFEKKGNRDKALFHNEKAGLAANKRQHEYLFNNAYFALTRQKILEALTYYKKIPDETNTNTAGIIAFLDDALRQKTNPYFTFAIGYITYRWEDEKEGKLLLERFITGNTFDDELLKIEAKKILE